MNVAGCPGLPGVRTSDLGFLQPRNYAGPILRKKSPSTFWSGARTDGRSRSDRARPKAVLGVGAGGGRPLPPGGSGGIIPGKFFEYYFAVDVFWAPFS